MKKEFDLNTVATTNECSDNKKTKIIKNLSNTKRKTYMLCDIVDIFWGEKIVGQDRQSTATKYKILRPNNITGTSINFEKRGVCYCSSEFYNRLGKNHRAIIKQGDILVRATGKNNYAIANQDTGIIVASHNVLVIRPKPNCQNLLDQVILLPEWKSLFEKGETLDIDKLSKATFSLEETQNQIEAESIQQLTASAKPSHRVDKIKPPVSPSEKKPPNWTISNILYVHKGTIGCQREEHDIIQATAVLTGKNESNIQLSVNYCRDCNKFFINYISYEEYRKKYGILIGNITLEDESKILTGDFSLAEASPLKLCGYSVNQQDGLSRETRHYIIQKIISLGIMAKSDVIRYLEYFITMNGKRRGNEIALSKWKDDLTYTLSVNFENQSKFNITKIVKY